MCQDRGINCRESGEIRTRLYRLCTCGLRLALPRLVALERTPAKHCGVTNDAVKIASTSTDSGDDCVIIVNITINNYWQELIVMTLAGRTLPGED